MKNKMNFNTAGMQLKSCKKYINGQSFFNAMKTVAIIGLGYVGLPLACLCAKKGYKVIGLEKNPEIIEKTNKGISHIMDEKLERDVKACKGKIMATNDAKKIGQAEFVVVCVPTPVDKRHMPDLAYVKNASTDISQNMKKGQVVIIESTIHPGTVEEIVKPILDKSKLKDGKDYFLAHCPERVDPGNRNWGVENLPRVIGSTTKEGLAKAAAFYRTIIDAEITELSSVKAAEAVKITENSFRDVNIAFVNELAKSFDRAGIDITEVIRGASTKPFAFMAHYPGCGVGGHCIPVDPYYLIEKARDIGFEHKFLSLAREINNSMPDYTIELLEQEMQKMNKAIKGSKIGVLGVAYKKNVDDMRESPALEIIEELRQRGAEVIVFDPWVKKLSNVKNINSLLEQCQYVIVATDHSEFTSLDASKFKFAGVKIIIDGKNCLDKEKIKSTGIVYRGIGRR